MARGSHRDRRLATRRAVQSPCRPRSRRAARGWKGSGRSIAEFDLHGGLAACSGHLHRFGGHRAAAGLSIETAQLEPFADAFGRHADEELAEVDLRPLTKIDAIVPAQRAHPRSCTGARPARAVRARQPGAHASRRERRGHRCRHGRGRQAPPVPRPPAGTRRWLCDRLRSGRPARAPRELWSARRRLPAEGEPLERDDRAAARRPARLRRTRGLRRATRVARRRVACRRAGMDHRCRPDLCRARAHHRWLEPSVARVGELPGAARARHRRAADRRLGRRSAAVALAVTVQRLRLWARRRSSRACRGASSTGRGRRRARCRPCRCRDRRRSPVFASSSSSRRVPARRRGS